MRALLLVLLTLSTTHALLGQTSGATDSRSQASSDWNRLVDSYFDDYFKLYPTQGTAAGFHQYDSELEDYSRKGVDNQIAFAKNYLGRLESFDSKALPLEERQDYQLVVNNLKSTLLELEDIRGWEKNPDRYSSGLTQSAFAAHFAQVCAAREAIAVSDRAREKDACSSCGGQGESQEPASNLHRSRDPATAGDRWLFPKGCPRSLQGRERPALAIRISKQQPGGNYGPAGL